MFAHSLRRIQGHRPETLELLQRPRARTEPARSPAREHAGARVKLRLMPRGVGMSYGDYPRFRGDRLPQLTCLLFLKARP